MGQLKSNQGLSVNSENNFEVLSSHFPFAIFNKSQELLNANEKFCSLFGFEDNRKGPQSYKELIRKDLIDGMSYKRLWNDLKNKMPVNGDFEFLALNGNPIWIHGTFIPTDDQIVFYGSDITDSKKISIEASIRRSMLDLSPINTMLSSPTGELLYMNKNSVKTLKTLEQYLPEKVENLIGKSIDIFHKNPEVQRRIIIDPSNLPHKAIIQLGPEKLDLLVSAVQDENGKYLGAMVNWSIVTEKLELESQSSKLNQMIDLSPINTMLASRTGELLYMNKKSTETLKGLEQYLPDKVENLIGKSIDIFHKNPDVQRRIISSASNLPHKARIQLGPEVLDLLVSPIVDKSGEYIGPMVTWDVVTERVKSEEIMIKMKQMVDLSPVNTMLASPDGTLEYLNKTSIKTLKTLEQYLPDRVENLIGKSVDLVHKNPAGAKRIFSNPNNLPHRAKIRLGPETLDLTISPVYDNDGVFLGPMVNWSLITSSVKLIDELTDSSKQLTEAASSLLATANTLSAAAEETSAQANTASVASEEVNAGVQTVSTNMEEMVASIKEITKTTNEASKMTNDALGMARNANEIINQLGESSMDIGNVIKVISSIAQQTNLLALNATIEAARAGEAGKGFAVVANEVKELAKQTAKATNDITKKIETIQSDSKNAVTSISEISDAIEKVNGYASNIAASVEEQAATTNEVTRIVTESAEGVAQINENVSQVSQAAGNTGKEAQSAQTSSQKLGELANRLTEMVRNLNS
ncbi:MAG: methyl-accepting chemotaxis protein [Halobacteriovoraceae bacterium]|nr:methyl-accepting chemotaxis protein [Halobacteriovoraceae bacterium]